MACWSSRPSREESLHLRWSSSFRKMKLSRKQHLLDINVLIALADETHIHHSIVMEWIDTPDLDWGVCAFTEAGFLRIVINPRFGTHTIEEANEVLRDLARQPGYRYWPVPDNWTVLTAPFS